MDYHQNARLTIHRREQLAKIVVERGCTLKSTASCFNVSAKTAAKWVGRYREQGAAGLKDRSSRPGRSPRCTSSAFLERVLALRQLRWNGWRIAHKLKLSRATVSRSDRTREFIGGGYEYLHVAIDDHSRIAFFAILPDETHVSAMLFFL